jgi:hypothetical protein
MDVSTLDKHGVTNTIEIHINSSLRNKQLYRNQNQYTIEFIENFRNVVGMEIVDARIPKTEYIINSSNNIIKFIFEDDVTQTCEIPFGDYDPNQFSIMFNKLFNNHGVEISLSVYTDQFILKCRRPFTIDLTHTTINNIMGFGDFTTFDVNIPSIQNNLHHTYHTYQSLLNNGGSSIISDMNVIFVQELLPTNTTYLYEIQIPGMFVIDKPHFKHDIQFNIRITSVNGKDIQIVSSPTPLFTFTNLILEGGETYFIHLYFSKKRWDLQNINIPVQSGMNNSYISNNTQDFKKNMKPFETPFDGINMQILFEDKFFSITLPGRFNFHGDNYICMHCNELDVNTTNGITRADNSTFKFCTTLRLCDINSDDDRFVPNLKHPRYFIPIPKIPRLSFTFESIKGQLYDFKGLDHNFTLRLYLINMIQNINEPFITQKENTTEIEAINEHIQYYNID